MPTLSITVPTFNRAAILKVWLKKHANLMQKYNIDIHIQDNCSNDETRDLVKIWKGNYSNISYACNTDNLPPTYVLDKALNQVETDFVWLVGDSYEIDEIILKKVLKVLKKNSPLFIITNLENRKKNFIKSELSFDTVSKELLGILSCLSCTIYNKNLLRNIVFNEKHRSWFPHTIYILKQLKIKNKKAYWLPNSVKILRSNKKRINWASTPQVFEIGAKNWISSINLIDGLNINMKKKAYKSFAEITGLFGLKGALQLRSQNLLTINAINKYSYYLKKSLGINYLLLYIYAAIPVFVCIYLKKIYFSYFSKP